ncbi:hypothetical protein CEW89_06530 [Celeribacter ethanolicus]|uniref:Uncharacterized protein n=1 Tax=Celeribacter ethanolicus TaxID=1758178 RepID=A0A291GB12_9RHOB|nr:hypothetical protein [Celeribacter ethanolicus]ATG47254.1 hypothetical protein CEW89_06530 [Celeribacter ethanolicus]
MADFRMKKIALGAIGVSILIVGVAIFQMATKNNTSETSSDPMTIERPENVPLDAVFRGGLDGGFFISLERRDLVLKDGIKVPAYWIEAYDSYSGIAEYKGMGIFISDREMSSDGETYFYAPPSVEDILSSGYFDGSELAFDIDGHAKVGRIIPVDINLDH